MVLAILTVWWVIRIYMMYASRINLNLHGINIIDVKRFNIAISIQSPINLNEIQLRW